MTISAVIALPCPAAVLMIQAFMSPVSKGGAAAFGWFREIHRVALPRRMPGKARSEHLPGNRLFRMVAQGAQRIAVVKFTRDVRQPRILGHLDPISVRQPAVSGMGQP